MLRAGAMVCFPGGFGTLDELFDALTLIQTGNAKPMPILLFDERYWRRIVNFDAMVHEGVISLKDRDLVRYVKSAEAAWRAICAHCDIDPALADGGS
jgi:predicted Rossmann-fold nucleotide-binding protein